VVGDPDRNGAVDHHRREPLGFADGEFRTDARGEVGARHNERLTEFRGRFAYG